MGISDEELGRRVHSWRERRGMSQADLASRIDGMTQPKLSQVENGDRRLTTSELADAAHALRVDPLDLIDPTPMSEGTVAAARGGSLVDAQAGVDLGVEMLRTWDLVERDGFNLIVGTPPVVPEIVPNSIAEGRLAAMMVREYLDLSDRPIGDLIQVADRLGVIAAYRPLGDPDGTGFDGVCVSSRGRAVAVINTAGKFRGRQRFTLGHELGHWVSGDLGEQPHIDIDVTNDGGDYSESRANSFAANLLVPDSIVHQVMTDDDAVRLAYDYGASILLMAYRVLNTNGDREMFNRLRAASRFKASRYIGRLDDYQKDRDAAGRSGVSGAYEASVRDALDAGAVSVKRARTSLPAL